MAEAVIAGQARTDGSADEPIPPSGDDWLLDTVRPRPRLLLGSLITGLLVLLLLACWGIQIRDGMGVAGINRPVFWGFYIVNFVFWIGISHAGTLISAILRVTHAGWRRPLTRCAEAITVFALMVGALFPLIHLGRPWNFYYLLPLPNHRLLWPNFRSPLVWDVAAITTYLIGSVLYLALPLIPDMALLRDRHAGASGLRPRVYRWLALGWRGTTDQWRALERGIAILAVVIIPVAVSVHTIVSWDFAMTRVPGWNSTIFGPYFVVGAIYSGIAVLMLAMALLRRGLGLASVLTDRVFNNLALLFLAMTLLWGYFTFAEHLTTWYTGGVADDRVHHELMHGPLSPAFWAMVVLNVVIPLAVLSTPRGRRPLGTAIAGACVVIGMWLERLLIVVPALSAPRLPFNAGAYAPSWIELGITLGSVGLFVFLYFAFVQWLPMVSVWEVREGAHEAGHDGEAPQGRVSRSGAQVVAVDRLAEDAHVVTGAFERPETLAELWPALADRGFTAEARSSVPLPEPVSTVVAGPDRRRGPILWLAIAGGLLGGLTAFSIAVGTARAYPLPTGGQPIVSLPPISIVTYEGTALGIILATVTAVVLFARLGRFGAAAHGLERELVAGRVLVHVLAPASGDDRETVSDGGWAPTAAEILTRHGAFAVSGTKGDSSGEPQRD